MSFVRAFSSFVRKASTSATKNRQVIGVLADTTPASSARLSSWERSQSQNLLNSVSRFTVFQPVAALHTEGDRRFVELLDEEIQQEKERAMSLTKMTDGWKASFDGASGKLVKTHDGDNIEVSFSLNGSIPPLPEEELGDDEESMVASYPEFTIKVSKPGSRRAIELECFFPDDVQDGVTDEEDDSANLFSIRSVLVYEGDITDGTYIIDTDSLEPKVYSYLLSYLADRGIDNQFADEFVEFTTAAEQQEYIRSLQKLKDFIGSK